MNRIILIHSIKAYLKASTAMGLFLSLLVVSVQAATVEQNIKVESATQSLAKKSQQRINLLSNETEDLLHEYQQLMQQVDYQEAYNTELKTRLLEQDEEIKALSLNITEVQLTRLHLLPLLRDMVISLEDFISLDIPFEQVERIKSVESLKYLLASSSVSLSEKFRRVMELYQAETDYSYTLKHYRGVLVIDSNDVNVEFLRVGRVAWYYQTPDGKRSALWLTNKKSWLDLPSSFNVSIREGMRVAEKQLPPQLLSLPFIAAIAAVADITASIESFDKVEDN